MADHPVVRRRGEAPERFEYRQALEQVANFVDNELGNGRVPQQRPDDREWRIQRAKTIRVLNEFREKLDTICVNANYGKAAGNGAEILGAGGAAVGAIMCLGGIPAGQVLKNVGDLVKYGGVFIEQFSNVVEGVVSAKYLSEIDKVLKVDQELSRPLMQWLNFSRQLDTNIQRIFGVSLTSETFHTVMKAFYEFSKLFGTVKGFETTMRLMRQERYSIFTEDHVLVEKFRKFFQECSYCPLFQGRIRVTLSVLSVATQGLEFYKCGVRIIDYLEGRSILSATSFTGGLNPEIPTTSEVSYFCFFQAISMAQSVMSLINAASIIKYGKSKYSDAIKEITHCLALELRQMEEL